ncbi:hypothetical protein NPIL_256631 [Nephila pilipes]|uniref:Uncharacterized protein n=1 Tax=Nephila pilipes TaxID=299642 RepID=A0A8X6QP47_NEPPI|nr:hypothetical protein NPIL_256631 [Nephila pilipes]
MEQASIPRRARPHSDVWVMGSGRGMITLSSFEHSGRMCPDFDSFHHFSGGALFFSRAPQVQQRNFTPVCWEGIAGNKPIVLLSLFIAILKI